MRAREATQRMLALIRQLEVGLQLGRRRFAQQTKLLQSSAHLLHAEDKIYLRPDKVVFPLL